jgi:hypothetical protein
MDLEEEELASLTCVSPGEAGPEDVEVPEDVDVTAKDEGGKVEVSVAISTVTPPLGSVEEDWDVIVEGGGVTTVSKVTVVVVAISLTASFVHDVPYRVEYWVETLTMVVVTGT